MSSSHNPAFDLAIQSTDTGYTVSLRAALGVDLPAEPLHLPIQFPALPSYRDIARFIATAREIRLSNSTELIDAKRVGGSLFKAIFTPEVLARFRASRDALPFGERLLLRLRLPAALTSIPWELLYDATHDQFLALADDLSLVRCPELATPLKPLQLDGPLQVLILLANPRGTRPIDLDRELALVEAALQRPIIEGRVVLEVLRGPATLEQLRRRITRPLHILHILCHGDLDAQRGEGVLLFEDPLGDKERITAAQLRMQIERQRGQTRLVLLNSCLGAVAGGTDPFSSVGAALVRGGVATVVAMQFEMPAESAQELARIFYTDLADGQPIDIALTEARRHLFGYDSQRLDWAIPALFMRGDVGALFQHIQQPIPPTRSENHDELYRQAMAAFFNQQWQTAHQLFLAIEQQKPGYRDVSSRLAEVQLQLGLIEQYALLREFRTAHNWRAVQAGLTDLTRRQANYPDPDGLAAWVSAAQTYEAHMHTALAAIQQRQWQSAYTELQAALAIMPEDTHALEQLALVEVAIRKQQDLEKRIRQQREAEELIQARLQSLLPIQQALKNKQYTMALDNITEQLRINPNDTEIVYLAANLIEDPAVPLPDCIRAGDLAGQYGDPRPGVIGFPPAMVAYAGGYFLMGNTQAEYQELLAAARTIQVSTLAQVWYQNTLNHQPSNIPEFELARYPVTNAQWALFIQAKGYSSRQPWWDSAGRAWLKTSTKEQPLHWDDLRFGQNHPNYPVVGITWYEASAFCRWLTEYLKDGFTYKLPSEMEWEYAARGSERRSYVWGNQPPDNERTTLHSAYKGPLTVGAVPAGATPEGVFDLLSSVWEWTRSEERSYPYIPQDRHEGGQHPEQKRFILRGGNNDHIIFLRAALLQTANPPAYQRSNTGMRLARYKD